MNRNLMPPVSSLAYFPKPKIQAQQYDALFQLSNPPLESSR